MAEELDLQKLVELHYQALYRFAFSLTRNESDASDLTQEAFLVLARSGAQIRELSKARQWLFTTLHREFLGRRRRMIRFPEMELDDAAFELPEAAPNLQLLDAPTLLDALARVDQPFQAVVTLFFLEDYSHAEIAAILAIPLGTVKSRIARGIAQLQRLLLDDFKRKAAP